MTTSAGQNEIVDIGGTVTPEDSAMTDIARVSPTSAPVTSGKGQEPPNTRAKSAREAVPGSVTPSSAKSKDLASSKGQLTRNSKEQRGVINRVQTAFKHGDYYAVLGVPEDATESEIKTAYKKTAKAVHSDKSGDNEATETTQSIFRVCSILILSVSDFSSVVIEAQEILISPDQRQKNPKPKNKAKATYGESFANGAWGDEPEEKLPTDIVELYDQARIPILQLHDKPHDTEAIRGIDDINDRIKNANEKERREESTGVIQYPQLQRYFSDATKYEDIPIYRNILRSNKERAIAFVKEQGYPVSWASTLAPTDDVMEEEEIDSEHDEEMGDLEGADDWNDDEQRILTENREPILEFSNIGSGHQFIVQTGARDNPTYDLRSGSEIGFHIAEKYLNFEGRVHLGKGDEYTRKDAKRYNRVIGVASKPLQTINVHSSRLPRAWVYVSFMPENKASAELNVWITRTMLGTVCGKASANNQIRNWYLSHNLTPVDDIPPRVIRRKLEPKKQVSEVASNPSIEALTAQIKMLTSIVSGLQESQKLKREEY
ncbi:MAG: hypothetical protein Q9228_001429 [Teloschistes exilis]